MTRWFRAIGPGILLAAVSVGASHLIQSTRAGAGYGMGMTLFIVLAMAAKYPAFRFAPQYAVATGRTMIGGFARQGRWILVAFVVLTAGTVFTGGAAITLVSAGILKATFHLQQDILGISALVLVVTAVLLIRGRYHWLDLVIKPIMLVLALATLLATALALGGSGEVLATAPWPARFNLETVLFVAALVGWMPAPIEAAIMHTMWSRAKSRDLHHDIPPRVSILDFHVGYLLTLLLALCFMLLGAGLMFGRQIHFEESASGFAAQLIDLYARTLGGWAWYFMGILAFGVMYSTVIAHVDGFARIFSELLRHLREEGPEQPEAGPWKERGYVVSVVLIGAGIMGVLAFLLTSFRLLIDVATTLSFLAAPALAILIHRSIQDVEVGPGSRPGAGLLAYSRACNVVLVLFAAAYLALVTYLWSR